MDRNKAIEIVKSHYPTSYQMLNEGLEFLIPELKEGEDERIRKKVIEVLKFNIDDAESQMQASRGVDRTFEVYACHKVISWLEKQGEQKETLCDKCRREQPYHSCQDITELGRCAIEHEQKLAWSEEDERILVKIQDHLREFYVDKKGYPYVAKPDSPEMMEMNWLNSIKNRVQPQPKQEWSVEDYNEIEAISGHLDNTDNEDMAEVLRNIRDKYYHTIPQNTWKPSDEQMEALEHFVRSIGKSGYASPYENNTKLLYSLLEQLKKLKG